MELSDRKQKILCIAVEEYIRECSPITSGGIKDITSLECSTATLRNELNALEAMGYLRQLHTSGGRVPTPQGYRYYVEKLLSSATATDVELDEVKRIIGSRTSSLNEIVSGIAKIVSEATNYPTVVMIDGYENLVLKEFKIIPLLDDKLMVLIGTETGYIYQTLDVVASVEECQDATNYLTNHFRGETIGNMIDNINQLEGGMKGEIRAFEKVVDTLIEGLKKLNKQRYLNVRREGSAKLIEDKKSVEEAKKALKVLDDEKELSSILELEGKGDIEVTVAEEDDSCSVVKAPLCVNGRQLASIGVIGPQRMDYAGIASALKVVIDNLNDLKGE
ncbi:MAG: heat-inducible transcription repressor HrcA [Clostridia bacterium]|jgi:heat-inducible transcriptional repressor|nr:heat-inducible transcription repressor HrcA [Clostridia bacterium]